MVWSERGGDEVGVVGRRADCGNNRASGEAPHFKNKRFF